MTTFQKAVITQLVITNLLLGGIVFQIAQYTKYYLP